MLNWDSYVEQRGLLFGTPEYREARSAWNSALSSFKEGLSRLYGLDIPIDGFSSNLFRESLKSKILGTMPYFNPGHVEGVIEKLEG